MNYVLSKTLFLYYFFVISRCSKIYSNLHLFIFSEIKIDLDKKVLSQEELVLVCTGNMFNVLMSCWYL